MLDLSATRMHGYELQRVLRALGQRGAQSRLAVLHPPRMLGLEGDEGSILGYQGVHGELAQLPRLSEVGLAVGFVGRVFTGPPSCIANANADDIILLL